MAAPKNPNTEAARAALAAKRAAARSAREAAVAVALFGDADAMSLMVDIMRQRRDKITAVLAALYAEQEQVNQWLAEHAPERTD